MYQLQTSHASRAAGHARPRQLVVTCANDSPSSIGPGVANKPMSPPSTQPMPPTPQLQPLPARPGMTPPVAKPGLGPVPSSGPPGLQTPVMPGPQRPMQPVAPGESAGEPENVLQPSLLVRHTVQWMVRAVCCLNKRRCLGQLLHAELCCLLSGLLTDLNLHQMKDKLGLAIMAPVASAAAPPPLHHLQQQCICCHCSMNAPQKDCCITQTWLTVYV
jgi:hypothetical protein